MDATCFRRCDDVVFELTGERAVLLDASGTELITLNPVGTLVWRALDEGADATTIAARLAVQFPEVPLADLEADVRAFLGELAELGVVVGADAAG